MRELKFRAWNSIDKCFCDNTTTLTNLRQFIKSKHYHPMQYTGLKDKNGVDIYEGDIVKFEDTESAGEYQDEIKSIGKIFYSESDMCFDITNRYQLREDCIFDIEVIGNIYENPELIKES